MKSLSLAVTVLAAALASPAFAQSTPRIDQRQANQEKRIDQGVASGELNKREAARLEKGQARVNRMENKAKADGVVTKKEKGALHHAQDKQSKRIHRQKHDKQVAPPANGSGG